MNKGTNHLLEAIAKLFSTFPKGRVLDLGAGSGMFSNRLQQMGFDVVAVDLRPEHFDFKSSVSFQACDITNPLPFGENSFEYILLTEVIEHLKNPSGALIQINRLLKRGGFLVLSTPNILSLKSRFRFLREGNFEYFREPPLDQAASFGVKAGDIHRVAWRYHELEFLLVESGFHVFRILTSVCEGYGLCGLLPLVFFQTWFKQRRSLRKRGLDYRRIHRIILSKELLWGRHLIVCCRRKS
ncbi:MAG: class I SAM-dependent methyltransferase [Candidatus Omnitrophota bacterium]